MKEEIDELVRDLTSVFPMPKSEVRRRIWLIYEAGQLDYARKLHLATIPPGITVSDFSNVQEVVDTIKKIGYQQALDELIKEWPKEAPIMLMQDGVSFDFYGRDGFMDGIHTGLELIKSKKVNN